MAAASFSAVAVPIKSGLSAVTILRRLLACARPLHFLPQSQSPRRGLCQVAHAAKPVVVDSTLKGIGDRNIAEAVNNILEMAGRATTRREVLHTDFLTPPVVKESILALEKLANVKAVAQGGYPQAERCRLSVGHPDDMPTDPDVVAALSITGNFTFDACSHGDFLGAILSTGIVREKVGDILLQGEKGSQVVVVPELTDFLMSTLDKVGNISVTCRPIPLLALEYEPPKTKTLRTVESSLRVDALASAGFKISRSKLVDLISNGDVRVNWSPVMKNGTTLKTGDVVSVSGRGRLKIGEITRTRKGKYAIELICYLSGTGADVKTDPPMVGGFDSGSECSILCNEASHGATEADAKTVDHKQKGEGEDHCLPQSLMGCEHTSTCSRSSLYSPDHGNPGHSRVLKTLVRLHHIEITRTEVMERAQFLHMKQTDFRQ
ncbi:hypothetical protein OPV22_017740 [Ensete ventricosum]|uniref:RNA-binding S4 domain-containing protein n=1 Tax=Ensete ventricosum TaxID=4639 RepID=A0AAV8QUD3_ENSVE|nr:hypothetical protein OPV22_017740 [Ensete ventricosum]